MFKGEFKAELPIKLEELLSINLNFDNLIKGISFLNNNDINIMAKIQDFDRRLLILEGLKSDINEIKIQSKNIQNTNDNLNRTIQSLQERFLKMDLKFNEIDKKATEAKTYIDEQHKKIDEHNYNLDHLNKVVEDNIKKTNKIDEELKISKKEISIMDDKLSQLRKKSDNIEELIQMKTELINQRVDENKKDIVKMSNNLTDLISLFNNLKNEVNIKNNEFNSSINNIIEHLSSGKGFNIDKKKIKENKDIDNNGLLIKNANDNILIQSTLSQIENEQKYFREFISKYNEDKEEYDNNFEKNDNEIEKLRNEINNIKKDIESSSPENQNKNKKGILTDANKNSFVTLESFKKINDNIRIITSSLSSTPTRDEFENTVRKINSRLETIELVQQGVTSGPRTMINSNLVQRDGEKNTYLTQGKIILNSKEEGKERTELKKLIIKTINEEMNNLNFSDNPKIAEILENINKCEEEISKNDSSIINIRNLLTGNSNQNEILILKNDLEKLTDEIRKKFNELMKNVNGDDEEESEEDEDKIGFAGFSIKKKIDLLIGKYHEIFAKLNAIQNKNNTLSKEIKEEVKQNLKNETLKVVEEFKIKLENFTNKFEIELRNKIDRGGLSIFADKLNSKIKGDLNEKLDKSELRKNNNQLNRKIDSLENKISKTLVDTIIDLQMDEAPLIIKKNSRNYELCASCNQPVKKFNPLKTSKNFYKNNSLGSVGKNSFRSRNNMNLSLNMNKTNANFNKKLPGIVSYTQSK